MSQQRPPFFPVGAKLATRGGASVQMRPGQAGGVTPPPPPVRWGGPSAATVQGKAARPLAPPPQPTRRPAPAAAQMRPASVAAPPPPPVRWSGQNGATVQSKTAPVSGPPAHAARPAPIPRHPQTIQRMHNGPEDDFALHGVEPSTQIVSLSPRTKQITSSAFEGGKDFFTTLKSGGNRLSRRFGFEGDEERRIVTAEHKRYFWLVRRFVSHPITEYQQLKGIIERYYETLDKEQNLKDVTDEFVSHQGAKMVGAGIAGIATIGVLSAGPTAFILRRYFGQFESTLLGRMKKFAVKTGIKKLLVAPVVGGALIPLNVFGAIENNLKDSLVVRDDHPRLYTDLRNYDYDLLASYYLPLIEAVDRERRKRNSTTSIKIEEI